MQAAVMGPIRLFDKTASINEKKLGEELAQALGPRPRDHAEVARRGDRGRGYRRDVRASASISRRTARRQYMARALGTP